MTSFPEKSAAYVLPSSHKYILLDDLVCSIAGCFDEPAGHVKNKKKIITDQSNSKYTCTCHWLID